MRAPPLMPPRTPPPLPGSSTYATPPQSHSRVVRRMHAAAYPDGEGCLLLLGPVAQLVGPRPTRPLALLLEPCSEVPDGPQVNEEASHLYRSPTNNPDARVRPTSIRLIGETDMDEAGQNRAESHHAYIGIAVSFDVKKGPSHGLLELLGSDDVLPLEPLGDRQRSTEGC